MPWNRWTCIERLSAPTNLDAESSVKNTSGAVTERASSTCSNARMSGFANPMSAVLKIASKGSAMPSAATSPEIVSVPLVALDPAHILGVEVADHADEVEEHSRIDPCSLPGQ